MGATALAVVLLKAVFQTPNIQAEKEIRNRPIQSEIAISTTGEVTGRRDTWSTGSYGITDLGNLRIAIRGCAFSGNSIHRMNLSKPPKPADPNNNKTIFSSGNRRFEILTTPLGSSCKFGGISFEIIQGTLTLKGQSFDLTGPKTLIVVDQRGNIESIEPMQISE